MDGKKKNAPELAALEASDVALATLPSITKYSTEPSACQIEIAPTLEEVGAIIADAARQRIEAALRDLNETRARIERERAARETALRAIQERVRNIQASLSGLAGERTTMELRARAFLGGDALSAVLGQVHLAFNARQLELEDALAVEEANAQEMREEIQAANAADALELQLDQQELERLESAAPEIAAEVKNLVAARQAAEAKKAEIARDLITRINAQAEQIGGVRRIRQIIEEAERAGVANLVTPHANRALEAARHAANARYSQAKPLANHLASEGLVPVIGDGRVEAWKEIARNSHGTAWTLNRVMVLRGQSWETETPRMPITRRQLPKRVQNSRWFKHRLPEQNVSAQ